MTFYILSILVYGQRPYGSTCVCVCVTLRLFVSVKSSSTFEKKQHSQDAFVVDANKANACACTLC